MNKDFILYEQALELKELGFDEPCFATYEFGKIHINEFKNDCPYELCLKTKVFPAPTFSQAFRWFREKYNLDISINTVYSKYNEILSRKYSGVIDNEGVFTNVGFYDTYEEAELTCLKKLIEIVKSNTPKP
jgi:hypothetical protein